MALSKKRDAERKRVERAKIRLDKRLSPSQESKPVQPKYIERPAIIMLKPDDVPSVTTTNASGEVWVDADGNPIYGEV